MMEKEILKNYDAILVSVQDALQHTQKDIELQIEVFYKTPEYKTYNGIRNDKGYKKWKEDVLKRFDNTCCVCLSKQKVIAHHLFSYKYYSDLRTDINNGVCLCEICHTNFNDIYTNVNTLGQFLEFRKKYKGKKSKRLSSEERHVQVLDEKAAEKLDAYIKRISKPTKKKPIVESTELKKIVEDFENLKMKLWNQYKELGDKYGSEKGIPFEFSGKTTTTLSAQAKLQKEVMRINTLIKCNKMKSKKLMASKFYMDEKDFCKILEDHTQYLHFSDAEITHLNRILSNDYTKENNALTDEINRSFMSGLRR